VRVSRGFGNSFPNIMGVLVVWYNQNWWLPVLVCQRRTPIHQFLRGRKWDELGGNCVMRICMICTDILKKDETCVGEIGMLRESWCEKEIF
jgi:hypothetical protein